MKKLLFAVVLVLSVIVFTVTCAFAEVIVAEDKSGLYDRGIMLKNLGKYDEALDAFTRAGGYADSDSWAFYCYGMLYIEQAGDAEQAGNSTEAAECIDQALTYFRLLSNDGFEDSANLTEYCQARKYELMGMTQKALDIYEKLKDTYDSRARYLKLNGGTGLPNGGGAPEPELISARAYKETDIYSGPGFSYLKEDMTVNETTDLRIVGQYESWYMIEFVHEDQKVRAWAQKFRIGRLEDRTPAVFSEQGKRSIKKEAAVGYGPGEEYMSRGITLSRQIAVTVITEEGDYTLVGFESTEFSAVSPMTGWIPTECLN